MLEQLVINNFNSGFKPLLVENHKSLVMMTCQRTLVISYGQNPVVCSKAATIHHQKQGKEAYSYLLEIICGLKSKMVGENEIVGQFKEAYTYYIADKTKCSKLLVIIEKLFKDAKEIRTNYLIGLTQKTYSSIARKQIVSKHKADKVLILGSGQLAEDLINQFKKKIPVYICARNTNRVQELQQTHGIEAIAWNDLQAISSFAFIANSIGFDGTLLDDDFFNNWSAKHQNKLFIDLGSPSSIQTNLNFAAGVMRLEDVFGEGAMQEDHKKQQINKALEAMEGIVAKRQQVFLKKNQQSTIIPNHSTSIAYV
jgi:glutamyl-tRNA reductase